MLAFIQRYFVSESNSTVIFVDSLVNHISTSTDLEFLEMDFIDKEQTLSLYFHWKKCSNVLVIQT